MTPYIVLTVAVIATGVSIFAVSLRLFRAPAARRIEFSLILGCAFILLLLPSVLSLLSGYQIEALRQEKLILERKRAALEQQEVELLGPKRLEELARREASADPALAACG